MITSEIPVCSTKFVLEGADYDPLSLCIIDKWVRRLSMKSRTCSGTSAPLPLLNKHSDVSYRISAQCFESLQAKGLHVQVEAQSFLSDWLHGFCSSGRSSYFCKSKRYVLPESTVMLHSCTRFQFSCIVMKYWGTCEYACRDNLIFESLPEPGKLRMASVDDGSRSLF